MCLAPVMMAGATRAARQRLVRCPRALLFFILISNDGPWRSSSRNYHQLPAKAAGGDDGSRGRLRDVIKCSNTDAAGRIRALHSFQTHKQIWTGEILVLSRLGCKSHQLCRSRDWMPTFQYLYSLPSVTRGYFEPSEHKTDGTWKSHKNLWKNLKNSFVIGVSVKSETCLSLNRTQKDLGEYAHFKLPIHEIRSGYHSHFGKLIPGKTEQAIEKADAHLWRRAGKPWCHDASVLKLRQLEA